MNKNVFTSHSNKFIELTNYFGAFLKSRGLNPIIVELLPNAGRVWTVAEKVEYCMGLCESALLIATPDEKQEELYVPRIDVSYELGRLRNKKVIILKEEKTRLPKSIEPVYIPFSLTDPQKCLAELDRELESIFGESIVIKTDFQLPSPRYRTRPVYSLQGKNLVPERPDLIQKEVQSILFTKPKNMQIKFVEEILGLLEDEDVDRRWIGGMMLEEVLQYDSQLVPRDAILKMSKDKSFSVRSSAAVCLFILANLAPRDVPLDILRNLSSPGEDWYVYAPARAALKTLAHKNHRALDLIIELASDDRPAVAHDGISALLDVVRKDPDVMGEDQVLSLIEHRSGFVKETAEEIIRLIRTKPSTSRIIRYSPF